MKRLFSLARPYRRPLGLLAALNCLSALAALAIPAIGGPLFDQIVTRGEPISLAIIALLVVNLAIVAVLVFVTSFQSSRLGAEVRTDLRRHLFDHVQSLPLEFHDCTGKGSLLALLTYESWRLGDFIAGTLASTPSRLLMVAGATLMMFRIDQTLALIVPSIIPAYYLILKIIGRKIRQVSQRQQEAEARAIQLAEEALEMVPATKAFTRELILNERYRQATQRVFASSVRLGRLQSLIDPAMALIAAVAAVLVLLTAGDSLRAGTINNAELFTFILYAILLSRPVSSLAHLYGEFQQARGTLMRMQGVLDEVPEDVTVSILRQPAGGDLRFENVHFAFPGRPPLLQGFDLEIREGETVALLGPNGSGKSAILGLLMRFYDPHGGRISIGVSDIAKLNLAHWRRHIGLVPQMPYLFNGTIGENIAFGSFEPAGNDAIESASKLAQAHEFIAALPDGYDTLIGDRGIRLSGGQRQRIALARALLKNPPILALDEATSMFDAGGEEDFLHDCAEALAGRTTILITHRPALLALADRKIELVNGRAVERMTLAFRSGTLR